MTFMFVEHICTICWRMCALAVNVTLSCHTFITNMDCGCWSNLWLKELILLFVYTRSCWCISWTSFININLSVYNIFQLCYCQILSPSSCDNCVYSLLGIFSNMTGTYKSLYGILLFYLVNLVHVYTTSSDHRNYWYYQYLQFLQCLHKKSNILWAWIYFFLEKGNSFHIVNTGWVLVPLQFQLLHLSRQHVNIGIYGYHPTFHHCVLQNKKLHRVFSILGDLHQRLVVAI